MLWVGIRGGYCKLIVSIQGRKYSEFHLYVYLDIDYRNSLQLKQNSKCIENTLNYCACQLSSQIFRGHYIIFNFLEGECEKTYLVNTKIANQDLYCIKKLLKHLFLCTKLSYI